LTVILEGRKMSGLVEYGDFDGIGINQLLRSGEVSRHEVIEAAIAKIEALNPLLNAVVTQMFDLALKQASGPLPESPLAGAPIILKDERADYAGVVTGNGCKLFDHISARQDAHIVTRYKAAGLAIIGKANLPELGISVSTESVRHGPARNPWNTDLTAGGSSGGSAVAVAARMVPIAHGTDAGGSIRIPASFCGAFGLKPTRARISSGPLHGEAWGGMTNEHAITRSVRDSAALLDASAGTATGDPYYPTPSETSFLSEVEREPDRLRIGMSVTAPSGETLDADIIEATHRTAKLLESLGHEIIVMDRPPFDKQAFDDAFRIVGSSYIAASLRSVENDIGRSLVRSDVEQMTWEILKEASAVDGISFVNAREFMHGIGRQLAGWCDQVDVMLTPTVGCEPFPLGVLDPEREDMFEKLWEVMRTMNPFCMIANVTGRPAMSVPIETSLTGMPIGMHFIGSYAGEGLLFRLAGQLERAVPWDRRRPQHAP
jgi:amidase